MKPARDVVIADPWRDLRRFTRARIALGRTGDSLPTQAVLEFGLAHARARDAVHASLPRDAIVAAAREAGYEPVAVHSAAADRAQYLRRPDLGRRLDAEGRARLGRLAEASEPDVVLVIADGLSAQAAARHALPLIIELAPRLDGWKIGPIVVAEQSRVALGDEIGELLGAEQVVMLIGERPGLSSPDSLGIYLTYRPRVGRSDAERNCISNVRPEGLRYDTAARKLHGLLTGARRLGLSGVQLKDESDTALPDAHRLCDSGTVV